MNGLPLLILGGFAAVGLFAFTHAVQPTTYYLVSLPGRRSRPVPVHLLEQRLAAAHGVGSFCVVDSLETSPPSRRVR
jgi:hypothetical protein